MSNADTRVVLITGAAGGLGSALVKEFYTGGWFVVAGYNQKLPGIQGLSILPLRMDVTSPAEIERSIVEINGRIGRVDALVNNAAIIADKLSWQLSDQEWDDVLAVGLKGAFVCARAVLPTMMARRAGHIINISSLSGRSGRAGQANYAAAKAGLIGFTQSLAQEVGSHDICVNAILPGVLETPMTAALTPAQRRGFAADNALGRLNHVEEVARFVVFLATMRDVSGQIFQLDSRMTRGL